MRLITKTILIFLALVLAGCAAQKPVVKQPTITDTVFVYPDCGKPPPRETIVLVPLTWQVIDGRFSISSEGYKKLAFNMSEIMKGVKELRLEVNYYTQCNRRPDA
jgi:hypothetical protein